MSVTTSGKSVSLVQDAKLLSDLLTLLGREQKHLLKADVDAIQVVLEEKSLLLQQLNLAAKQRYDALAAHGYEANEAGMEAWVQHEAKPAISASWTNFQKSLNEAKEMNRLNGLLIAKNFSRNQELLNLLQGNSGADAVYGKDGQSKTQSPARSGLSV